MENWTAFAKVYNPLKAGSIDGTDTRPHDCGIERAMKAKYKPQRDHLDGDTGCTLFVSRLNPDTDEKSLLKAFHKYGDIIKVTVVRDIVTGFSKCYGFVEFEKEKSALHARQDAHDGVIDERVVFVDWEFSRSLPGWVPRRLGGGFGGQKESGQLRFGGRDRPFKKPIHLQQRSHQPRDKRGYQEERDRYGDRRRDKDRYRERDQDRERNQDRDRERNRDRDRDRDRDRGRDRDRDRDRRERDRDSDRRKRVKDWIKKEDEDTRLEKDESRREKEGRY